MPRLNGTGPEGRGPASGLARGRCATGVGAPSQPVGAGRGRGFGGRFRFWGRTQAAPVDPEQEKGWLRRQADLLKGQLDAVARRLSDLEKPDKS